MASIRRRPKAEPVGGGFPWPGRAPTHASVPPQGRRATVARRADGGGRHRPVRLSRRGRPDVDRGGGAGVHDRARQPLTRSRFGEAWRDAVEERAFPPVSTTTRA
jgi:hypothetical protein